jgi:hypothetical protein
MDSKAGAIFWHGPHHLAVKSMTTTRCWVSEGTWFVCFRPYIFFNVAKKLLQCSQLFHGLSPGFTTRSSTFKGDRRTNDGTPAGRATNHTSYASHRSTSLASHHTPHIGGGSEGSCAAAFWLPTGRVLRDAMLRVAAHHHFFVWKDFFPSIGKTAKQSVKTPVCPGLCVWVVQNRFSARRYTHKPQLQASDDS